MLVCGCRGAGVKGEETFVREEGLPDTVGKMFDKVTPRCYFCIKSLINSVICNNISWKNASSGT